MPGLCLKPLKRRPGLVSTIVWSGVTQAAERTGRLPPLVPTAQPAALDPHSIESLVKPSWATEAELRIKQLEESLAVVTAASELTEQRRLDQCSVGCTLWAERTVKDKRFDRGILSLIVINCIFMAASDPTLEEDEGVNIVCAWTDYVFTLCFTVELVIKLIAIGAGQYFGDSWNILDFCCVMIGYLGMIPGSALGAFSGLKALRAMRPLRTLNSIPAMKNLVATVFTSAKLLSDVFVLIFFLLFLFAIISLQFFAGKFRWRCFSALGSGLCNSAMAPDDTEHCAAGWSCQETLYNPNWGFTNFDNCISAMFNIFMIMSTEAWTAVMYQMMDSVSIFTFLYCSCIIFLLTVFSLNLTAAILASRFALARMDKQRTEEAPVALEGPEEPEEESIFKRCLTKCRACMAADPDQPLTASLFQRKIGVHVKKITDHKFFEYGTGTTMAIYCIFLSAKYYPMSPVMESVFDWVDKVASGIFLVELALKLLAEPWAIYFESQQNSFDAIVVVLTFADIFFLSALGNVAALRMVRLLRVLQAGRSLARLKSFWRVVSAVQHTFKSMIYFCMLLLLVMVIYALLAKELFGGKVDFEVFLTGMQAPDEGDIDDRINLNTFIGALTAVFAVLTGMWSSTCWATMYSAGTLTAIFWMSLIVVGNFVLLNLLLAVLIDKISSKQDEDDEAEEDEEAINKLIDAENERKREEARDVARRLKSMGVSGSLLGQFADEEDDLSDYERWDEEPAPLSLEGGTVWVEQFKGFGLPSMDLTGESDPYLKIYVGNHEQKVTTEHIQDQPNPVWGDSCRHQFLLGINTAELTVEVWDFDLVGDDDLVGKATVNLFDVFSAKYKPGEPVLMTEKLTGTESVEHVDATISFGLIFEPRMPKQEKAGEDPNQTDIDLEQKTTNLALRLQEGGMEEKNAVGTSRHLARRLTANFDEAHHKASQIADGIMLTAPSRSRNRSRKTTVTRDPAHGIESANNSDIPSASQVASLEDRVDHLLGIDHPNLDELQEIKAELQRLRAASLESEPPGTSSIENDRQLTRSSSPEQDQQVDSRAECNPPANGSDSDQDLPSPHHRENNPASPSSPKIVPDPPADLTVQVIAAPQEPQEPSGCCSCLSSKVTPEISEKYEVGSLEYRAHIEEQVAAGNLMVGDSLLVLGPNNCVRVACHRLARHPAFEGLIITLILISCVMLAMETPGLDKESTVAEVLGILNLIFTAIFIVEMLAKIIAAGFICGESAYLKDPWNKLDFLIVLISVVSLMITSSSLKALKALRALRALRPLRLISRLKGLKVVFNTIISVLPNLTNVLIFMFIVWCFFGILGVHAFGGMYWRCNQSELDQDQCVGTCTDAEGESVECAWTNSDFNFDNIGNAMVTLFVIGTLDDWTDQLWEGVDVTKPGLAPKVNEVPYLGLYFVTFIVLGSFLVLNLFVGEIVNAYSTLANNAFVITPEQRQWVVAVRINLENSTYCEFQLSEDVDPSTCWGNIRAKAFDLCLSLGFEKFIMIVIVLNILSLALQFYGQSDAYTEGLETANLVFSAIFLVEFIVKMLGLGPRQYVSDAWNLLDGFVVFISVFGIVSGLGGKLSVLRAMRMLRIAKLVRTMRGLRSLIATLFCSLPALGNVGMLMELNLFIFSVLGMNLFGEVSTTEARQLNDNFVNFKNVWSSHLVLFRVLTFDDWKGILMDCMQTESEGNCTDAEQNCGSLLAIPFFVMYIGISVYVLLNIFTAVILLNFQSAALEEGLSDMGFLSSALYKSRRFNTLISDLQHASLEFLASLEPKHSILALPDVPTGNESLLKAGSEINEPKEDSGAGLMGSTFSSQENPLQSIKQEMTPA